ncbi:hypothetical protein RJ639_032776 [Escallonia herrerae]|uniref:Pentatricopeptide repeat-containing protein n=1 Tax=Escallonia herrerae TaxID=1293975 RepID=A0AA89BJD9_9ASTE|nr:hypothetical protein RJ639_032776 [Escallonia herrerae]
MVLFSCCLFQSSPYPSSWNKAIKKQVLEENHERAILTFNHMQATGVSADSFTYPVLLKAIGALSLRDTGFALHGHIIKTGFSGDAFVQTALLGMYSSFRCIGHACKVFEQMTVKDVVAWNSMLSASVSHGEIDDAAILFDLMPSKDLLSYNVMISGYASIGSVTCARNVFDESPVRDVVSWNSMILACGNAGDIREARKLFEEMPERSVITWNTMLVAYLNNELPEDAVALFEKMKISNVKPDYLTLTHVVSACAHKWREMMNDAGIAKSAGCSVIEIQGRTCKFLAGDNSKMD